LKYDEERTAEKNPCNDVAESLYELDPDLRNRDIANIANSLRTHLDDILRSERPLPSARTNDSLRARLLADPFLLFDAPLPVRTVTDYAQALKRHNRVPVTQYDELDLVIALYEAARYGSTCLPHSTILPVGASHITAYNGFVYRTSQFTQEREIAMQLRRRLRSSSTLLDNTSFASATEVTGLHPIQAAAVRQCLTHSVSCVTGGPGTGKSFLLRALQKQLVLNNPSAVCAIIAMTGVVVCKLHVDVREGSTVCLTAHSYLNQMRRLRRENASCAAIGFVTPHHGSGILDKSFLSPLCHTLVAIDESTMVDNVMLLQLLKVIPRGTHLVLLGDLEQLPSIGAGAVLREAMVMLPTTVLSHMYRQRSSGGGIQKALQTILSNNAVARSMEEFTADTYDEGHLEKMVLGYVWSEPATKVLAWTNNMVTRLNKMLQSSLNPMTATTVELLKGAECLREGDRVICTKNQDNLVNGVANGSNGRLTAIRDCKNKYNKAVIVTFDHGYVHEFIITTENKAEHITVSPKGDQLPLRLGYALTVFKAQGSEYETVLYVDDWNCRRATYTAVSRAKTRCCLLSKRPRQATFKTERPRYSQLAHLFQHFVEKRQRDGDDDDDDDDDDERR
jgi:exodeoxyribonuclease V alpha subunit